MRRFISLVLVVSILFPSPSLATHAVVSRPVQPVAGDSGSVGVLFRTTVTLRQPTDRTRLDQLGVVVLSEAATQAVVLADADQLETLARLRFEPTASDELGVLVAANATRQPWLAASLQPLLAKAQRVASQATQADHAARADALAALREAVQALSPEQIAGINTLSSVDEDGDGLTNTQEAWWCTDPNNPDSDNDGVSDFTEVQAAKDWLANRRSTYAPNGPPYKGWPMVPGDANFNANCIDRDQDVVPDAAESWELGLNPNRESTDRDKFDDGQEMFGLTKWGWGALPRTEDTGIIFSEMPSWVKAPGNHPLVAAFPVPEIDVVPSSFNMETVTTVTTDHIISSGTERSYSTAKTEGTSTSVANTETWNDWQEIAVTASVVMNTFVSDEPRFVLSSNVKQPFLKKFISTAKKKVGGFLSDIGSAVKDKVVDGLVDCTVEMFAEDYSKCLQKTTKAMKRIGRDYSLAWQQVTSPDADLLQKTLWLGACVNPIGPITCRLAVHGAALDTEEVIASAKAESEQDRSRGGSGSDITFDPDNSQIDVRSYYQIAYPLPKTTPMETTTSGSSWGGARTETHTEYEEHTITNGEAFSTGESWGTATAVDSSRAAELWFTYRVRNTGTEYAREIADLAFNIYLGDNPNPIYTYFVGPDLGGDGKFHNFMPNEEHTYTSRRIPLTLEQMRTMDLGGPIRIVVEDFTYGVDELFYQDAANAGAQLAIEDGLEDGDESIDSYLIPTWGSETVMDVLARYFPHTTDVDGNLIAVWTPEYRADTPAWCDAPQRTGGTLWCEHALSTADWWNVYLNKLGDGTSDFQSTQAVPGSVALFRFNKDSDLDGYSDRSEILLGTDPYDAASHPNPELIAGVRSLRSSDRVTATLSLLNTGLYDAYGVEAVMIAPNDSITVTNNTVGGSGRVRAGNQVVVGSLIKLPTTLPSTWAQTGHARPIVAGYYGGDIDRVYTFTALDTGAVATNTLRLSWSDGTGVTGTLNFGTGYASPTPITVSNGVKLGLMSGSVSVGDVFTLTATTPRDTFQYQITREPHDEPLVLVSYNDPQGNHRFIVPVSAMNLSDPTANLASFAGQMLPDPGVEIVTTSVFTTGVNTTTLVVNNPSTTTLVNAHLFMEFINISGTVASEVPVTVTLPPGPSVVPITWTTGVFSPTFNVHEDYIAMAFWTDYQGNILDTAARPLSSFQVDPKPAFAMSTADQTWNFGTVTQGEQLQHTFTFGSTGFVNLLTYLGNTSGLTVTGTTSRNLAPGDTATYTVTLDTTTQPVGAFSRTLTLRTSDPANPTRTATVLGNIVAPVDAANAFDVVNRPWDKRVLVYGNVVQYTPVDFAENIQPDAASIEPCMIYAANGTTLKGVGKYCSDFGINSLPYQAFGDGRDGNVTLPVGTTTINTVRVNVTASGTNASPANSIGFAVGDLVLFHQARQTANVGRQEFNTIVAINSPTSWTLAKPLTYSYDNINGRAQAIKVLQYQSLTIPSGATLTAPAWDGSTGGFITFLVKDTLTVQSGGRVVANSLGYFGGAAGGANTGSCATPAWSGEGWSGASSQRQQTWSPDNGGTGGVHTCVDDNRAGSSGSNATRGDRGYGFYANQSNAVGDSSGDVFVFGGGGGGSLGNGGPGGSGGRGGGHILIQSRHVLLNGTISASGGGASSNNGVGGGGGAGGNIKIVSIDPNIGVNLISSFGGPGGGGSDSSGGTGGKGWIYIHYQQLIGTTADSVCPPVCNKQVAFYIAEKTSDTNVHFTVPDAVTNGQNYVMQFGRHFAFGASGGTIMTPTRLLAQNYANATLDALITNVGVGGMTNLQVMVGTQTVYSAAQTITQPTSISLGNFATALNTYLASQPANTLIDVPMTVTLNRQADVILTNLALTPGANVDAALAAGDVTFGASSPTEGASVPITLTLHNTGNADSGGLTAAVFATPTLGSAWYVGSAYVPNIPANGAAQATIQWNTLGFTGTTPVRVVVDPYNRVAETNETNNTVVTTLTIRTRPDLNFAALSLFNDEPVTNETVTVTLSLRNLGQTAAGAHSVALYQGNPDTGGVLISAVDRSGLAGNATTPITFTWTPTTTGSYRLFARADRNGQIDESDESNNDLWTDVYVGFHGPILIDSGAASDEPYTSTTGYGYVDLDQPDVIVPCGTQPHETLRMDPGGQVGYRFDHLLPGHFYHLDVTLYECDGAGRQESVFVDGNRIAGPEDLIDGRVHRLSLRLDPALYADRTISVTIAAPGIDGAVVSAINLYDIDYRYADAGGPSDPAYPGGRWITFGRAYGYTNGVTNTLWGTLPYSSVHVNQISNTVSYRFDGLLPTKQYQVNLTFWQPSGAARLQKIQIDGVDTGATINTGDYQLHQLTVDVPGGAYADGRIDVGIVRTNAATGAFVNEIALEELTAVLPPVTNFAATPTSGYAPLTVQFTDQSSGAIASRSWAFGDGGTATIPNPLHTYQSPGVYDVSLTTTGPGGTDILTRSQYITVTAITTQTVVRIQPPVASASVGSPITVAVMISNVTNLGSFQFTLGFNPARVQVQAVTLGEFPGSTGRSFTPVGPTIDNVNGTAVFGAFSLGGTPPGPNGSGNLAYVRLQPISGGTSALTLSNVQVSNVAGGSLPFITQDGLLSIAACLGDFDGDGDVDILDVQRVAYRWGAHTGQALYDPLYDVEPIGSPDGDIDILDVQVVAYRWGMRCSMGQLAQPSALSAPATLSIQPYSRTVSVNQTFTTSVWISDVADLGAFEFTLAYSPTLLEVMSATIAPFPSSTGRAFTPAGLIISPTAGTATFGAFSLGASPAGANGHGALAILTLKALNAGQSDLNITAAQISDRSGAAQVIGSMLNGAVAVVPASEWKVYLPFVLK